MVAAPARPRGNFIFWSNQIGFSREELDAFARALNGHGIDRMVPLGSALRFSHVWNGYDLLEGLTRTVAVSP
jgi:hypothetical protein